MIDNYDLFEQHEIEAEEWLKKLPICDVCCEPIQTEYSYVIGGEYICENCIENFRRNTDSLIDD